MKLPMVQIRTTPIKLSYETKPAKVEMHQEQNVLRLETVKGELEMQQKHAKVMIDQTQCFNEAGLMTNGALLEDTASYSKQKAIEGIGRIVNQGNQLASIENGGNPLADQAEHNAYGQFIKEWNIGFIPTSRPQITVEEGGVEINYTPAKVINNTEPSKPSINYTAGKVDMYVKQYNSIEFSVIDLMG